MTIPPALLAVFTLSAMLLLGKLGEEALSRLRMVPFAGAIVVGLLLGPSVLGALAPNPYIEEFVDLGVVFILSWPGRRRSGPARCAIRGA
jgi:Kef-type K+ transport system membrane component KefB